MEQDYTLCVRFTPGSTINNLRFHFYTHIKNKRTYKVAIMPTLQVQATAQITQSKSRDLMSDLWACKENLTSLTDDPALPASQRTSVLSSQSILKTRRKINRRRSTNARHQYETTNQILRLRCGTPTGIGDPFSLSQAWNFLQPFILGLNNVTKTWFPPLFQFCLLQFNYILKLASFAGPRWLLACFIAKRKGRESCHGIP